MTIKQIGILSIAKFLGILYGGLGLIAGLIVSLISIIGSLLPKTITANPYSHPMMNNSQGTIRSLILGVGAVIFLPILYGILGFIVGIVAGFIANIALRVTGGIVLKVDK